VNTAFVGYLGSDFGEAARALKLRKYELLRTVTLPRFIDNRDRACSATEAQRSYRHPSALRMMHLDQNLSIANIGAYKFGERSNPNIGNRNSLHPCTSADPEESRW
jgi:hypothetical protein